MVKKVKKKKKKRELITLKQAAAMFGKSQQFFMKKIEEGKIRKFKPPLGFSQPGAGRKVTRMVSAREIERKLDLARSENNLAKARVALEAMKKNIAAFERFIMEAENGGSE